VSRNTNLAELVATIAFCVATLVIALLESDEDDTEGGDQ
jgi:hypothetical protein